MHLEVLVEDASGSIAAGILLEKILGPHGSPHSWRIHQYKGLGKLPRDLHKCPDVRKRILLENLPRLLAGYGKALQCVDSAAVLVIVDSDRKDCIAFKAELTDVLQGCTPAPRAIFRIAIEEMEAWLMGDRVAVEAAYPHAKRQVIDRYGQDSVCGTWEVLADAIHPGGSVSLKKQGYPIIGQAKCNWACHIAPHMDIERNVSKSFLVFRDGVLELRDNLASASEGLT
ncbi:MAG TPA: DUF4276 family protein [Phycisphaerae bacterium]|nr:DUF4276 family protein [Phycisphaerae bacterium]